MWCPLTSWRRGPLLRRWALLRRRALLRRGLGAAEEA